MSDVEAQCPYCGGCGYIEAVRPACCGNLTPAGSCRADCYIPEQYQDQCGNCGGSGAVLQTPPQGQGMKL